MIRTFFVGATLALAVVASPVAATVLVATYTGLASGGYDGSGEFIAAGTSFSGQSYVATYTYDTNVGTIGNDPGVQQTLSSNFTTPALTGTITINGVTKSFAGTYSSFVIAGVENFRHHSREASDDGVTNKILNEIRIEGVGTDPTPALLATNVAISSFSFATGTFHFSNHDYVLDADLIYTFGDLSVTSYTVTGGTDAVPEPAAWLLMIGGFGMVGAVMRRRVMQTV